MMNAALSLDDAKLHATILGARSRRAKADPPSTT